MGIVRELRRSREGAKAPNPRSAPQPLTKPGKYEMMTSSPKRGVSKRPFSKDSKPLLEDSKWLNLVEQLSELSPVDFDSAVLAVRLRRRFEEESRRTPRVGTGTLRAVAHCDDEQRGGPQRPTPRIPPEWG
jgi:hypothetical protein